MQLAPNVILMLRGRADNLNLVSEIQQESSHRCSDRAEAAQANAHSTSVLGACDTLTPVPVQDLLRCLAVVHNTRDCPYNGRTAMSLSRAFPTKPC